jgi:hypothetical protein
MRDGGVVLFHYATCRPNIRQEPLTEQGIVSEASRRKSWRRAALGFCLPRREAEVISHAPVESILLLSYRTVSENDRFTTEILIARLNNRIADYTLHITPQTAQIPPTTPNSPLALSLQSHDASCS